MTYTDSQTDLSKQLEEKYDWQLHEIKSLLEKPLMDLLWEAQTIHRKANPGYKVQLSSLLSVKTGGCQEDCAYCPQSIHSSSDVTSKPDHLEVKQVISQAKAAKDSGAELE